MAGSSDGRERRVLKGHTGAVVDLAVRADAAGKTRIASASEDGTGRIWTISLAGGAAAKRRSERSASDSSPLVLTGHKGPVRGVAFLPDGGAVVSGGDDGTRAKLECP